MELKIFNMKSIKFPIKKYIMIGKILLDTRPIDIKTNFISSPLIEYVNRNNNFRLIEKALKFVKAHCFTFLSEAVEKETFIQLKRLFAKNVMANKAVIIAGKSPYLYNTLKINPIDKVRVNTSSTTVSKILPY